MDKQEKGEKVDDLDEDLDQFDEKLNLTAGEEDMKAMLGGDMDKEYKKFMENMQQMEDGGAQDQMPQFENMLSGLLNELGGSMKDGQGDPDQAKNLENMFKGLQGLGDPGEGGDKDKNPQLENFADNLLNEFMEKEIIYEPLLDARKQYDAYLAKDNEGVSSEDASRYQQ